MRVSFLIQVLKYDYQVLQHSACVYSVSAKTLNQLSSGCFLKRAEEFKLY